MKHLTKEIHHFGVMGEGVYRGAQPSEKALQLLKDFGIKTIINFRHETKEVETEKKQAEALGFRYVHIPWRIQKHPKNEPMKAFLNAVGDSTQGPFFVHCRRGAERTGVAEAIYQYYVEKKPKQDAWKEATKDYHVKFIWKPFIKDRFRDFISALGPQSSPRLA